MPTTQTPDTRPNVRIEYYSEKDPQPTGQVFRGFKDGVEISKEEALFYWLEQHAKNTVIARMAAEGLVDIDDREAVAALWEIKNDQLNFKVGPQDKAKVESLLAGLSVSING